MLDMLHTLNMQNIKYIDSMDILTNYKNISKCKDANEMLLKDSKELKTILSNIQKQAKTLILEIEEVMEKEN